MKMFAVIILLSLVCITRAAGQSPQVDENCNMIRICAPVRDCSTSAQRDTRSCNKCLVTNPFGGCALRGNDPFCEASKAAQNSIYEAEAAAKKLDCERQKAVEKAACETEVFAARSSCQIARGQVKNELLLYLLSHNPPSAANLPRDVSDKLLSDSTYQRSELDRIRVIELSSDEKTPNVFDNEKQGFTIDNVVFLRPAREALHLRFWVRQLEFSRLFSSYGVDAFGKALLSNPEVFSRLVDVATSQKCENLSC